MKVKANVTSAAAKLQDVSRSLLNKIMNFAYLIVLKKEKGIYIHNKKNLVKYASRNWFRL